MYLQRIKIKCAAIPVADCFARIFLCAEIVRAVIRKLRLLSGNDFVMPDAVTLAKRCAASKQACILNAGCHLEGIRC